MIAEDFEMIPVIRNNQTLLGVITRRAVMDRMSKEQLSGLPTFSEQISQKVVLQANHFELTVEPSMLEKSGVLSNGVLTEVLTTVTRQLMMNSGKKFNYRTAVGLLSSSCSSGRYLADLKRVLFAKQDDRLL